MPQPTAILVVGGTSSGVGKTTVACGLMAAFARRGLTVQPFKCGPDFLDGMHHEEAVRAGGAAPRRCVNLDGWMMGGAAAVRAAFGRHARGADVCVVEGVMGLHDGRDGVSDVGSTAEIAKTLGAPVVLAVNAGAMCRSAAAMVLGYLAYDPDLRVGGVVANHVSGMVHKTWVADALKDPRLVDAGTGRPVVFAGALPKDTGMSVPERHLGLHMPRDEGGEDGAAAAARFRRLAAAVEEHLDLDALLALGRSATPPATPPAAAARPRRGVEGGEAPTRPCRVGVAQDGAFCFYYQANLQALEDAGAEVVPFSPLADPRLPAGVDALYLGGGYPELHADALAANAGLREDIRSFADAGGVVLAECGGLMYLTGSVVPAARAAPAAMCGVFAGQRARMTPHCKLFYAEVEVCGPAAGVLPAGTVVRGHKFHFSAVEGVEGDEAPPPPPPLLVTPQHPGAVAEPDGFAYKNVLASYYHLYFDSARLPLGSEDGSFADAFVAAALRASPARRARAASFVTAATEVVFALGADAVAQLGGVTSLCDYPQEARRAPRRVLSRSAIDASAMTSEEVAAAVEALKAARAAAGPDAPPGHWWIDAAGLAELAPEVVFVQSTCAACDVTEDDVLHALHATNLLATAKVVPVSPNTLDGVMASVADVAGALGLHEAGAALADRLRARLTRVAGALDGAAPPRVVSLEGLAPLCVGGGWLPDLKAAAGCVDAFGDVGGCAPRVVSWGDVAAADPDALVVSPCSAAPERTFKELHLLAAAPEFWRLRCVQQGAVYVLDHGPFSRPGPRLIDGVELLASLLRGVPPPSPAARAAWATAAYKYECDARGGDAASHCTTELAVRFKPCYPAAPPPPPVEAAAPAAALRRVQVTRSTVAASPLPPSRSAHVMVALPTQGVLLVAGEGADGARMEDVWKLSAPTCGWGGATGAGDAPGVGTTGVWQRVRCGKIYGEAVPVPRSNHAAVVCGEHLLVFGGWGAACGTPLGAAELLHLESWCWTHCSVRGGAAPPPRGNPTLVYSPGAHQAVLFGGWDGVRRYDDLWVLDLNAWGWKQIPRPAGAAWPAPRTDHSAVLYEPAPGREVMLVYGGSVDGQQTTGEMWAFDLAALAWRRLTVSGAAPPPRTSHAAAVVGSGASARMVVVGGTDASKGSGRAGIVGDAWALDLREGGGWAQLPCPDGAARCRHSAVAVGGDVVVWGGYDGEEVIDEAAACWVLSPGGCAAAAAAPPARRLQERWAAEVPLTEADLPEEALARARASTLPGAVFKALHREALRQKRDTYIDPASGYSVFTGLYLKRRPCCGNGCRHCPHGHVNVPGKKKQQPSSPCTSSSGSDLDW